VELQDKIVEDLEARHAESRQREDVEAHGEETLPAPQVEALIDASSKLRGELLGAIRMLLEHQPLDVEALQLPEREKLALDALRTAVEGRDSIGHFVYAEDRRDLLEQALAVLQPDLTRADDQTARDLQVQFEDLTAHVGDLRHALTNLEDAQDELVEGRHDQLTKDATEPTDKPKPKPKPSDPDAPRPPTTLTGPERPEPPTPAPTVYGPERPEPPRAASTVYGPERPEPPTPAPTVYGPERPEPPRAASTVYGPERPEPPRPPSLWVDPTGGSAPRPAGRAVGVPTPGDLASPIDAEHAAERPAAAPDAGPAGEAEDKAKSPWWRRPFG
jgi:hypothetical protein